MSVVENQKLELAYENEMAHRYNRDYHEPPIMKMHAENFVKYISSVVRPGDRVLDLGCASASLWDLFKKNFDESVSLVGVDISEKMLDEARKHHPDGDFRIGEMTAIPCESGAFDVVIVSSAFHHIADSVLPLALAEINRVLDEHGTLIGREPVVLGRLGDRGGWISAALMSMRHAAYRLTHTREYPEPDPGPDHHAYDPKFFLGAVGNHLKIIKIDFRNPVSLFFSRIRHPIIANIAMLLDQIVGHKEGQEVCYVAGKNYYTHEDAKSMIAKALEENHIGDMTRFLAYLDEANRVIARILEESQKNEK
jgi:ubiquinone/menaquinone biosynthesis C-methylase UbiE